VRRHAKAPSAGSTEGNGNSRGLLSLVATIAVLASLVLVSSAVAAEPPVITIDHNPVASYDSADVSGTIISGKEPVFYRFEYSTDPDTEGWQHGLYGRSVPPGATPQTVSDHLGGLKAGTHYEVRLVVEDIELKGQYFSPEPNPSFTTLPVAEPIILAADDASSIGYTTAHLSGSVERPAGDDPAFDALCVFEYVTDAQFNAEGFPAFAPRRECDPSRITEVGPTAIGANLNGLQAGTNYHIRLLAENAGGVVTREAEHTFTTLAVAPPTLTIDPITDFTGFSAHVSGTVNPQAPSNDSVFDVNWHFECLPSCETHGGGTILADASPHSVARTVTGLEPNTTYQITLVASNAGGPTTAGPVTVTTPKVTPGVQTLFAGAVQANSATLAAKVNPLNSPSTYRFEWGTDSGYGNAAPAAPVSLGASDNSLHFVTTPLAGLQEATTYHFRISATNTDTGETAHGVDHTFTTLAVAGPPTPCPNEQRRVETNSVNLSDCRGYELIMPAVKDYPFGQFAKYIAVAAPSGNAVAYNTFGPLPGSEGGTQDNYAVARRGDGGWVTTSISPRQNPAPGEGTSVGFQGFSRDLSTAILGAEEPPLTPDAPPGVRNLYLRNTETGAYTLLTTRPGTHALSPFIGFAGASTDLTHVVFGSPDPLTEGLPDGFSGGLFEWTNGQLRYVGVLPDGTSAGISAVGGRYTHVVSEDGRRIVFEDVNSGQVYDRIDGTSTLEVSASQRMTPDPNGPQRAKFWGATADGGTVYITSPEALTDEATTGVDGDGRATDAGADLYAYDVDSETLTDLSVDSNPLDLATGANVQGVVGTSEDGQYVYFVALGDLAGDAASGVPNLYLRHGDDITYIGALDPNDKQVWDFQQFSPGGVLGVTSRVTPDGRNMLFQSIASLTGYDNVNPSTGAPTSQAYRYSADADTLSCVSCRPDGTPPAGDSTIPPPNCPTSTPRNISTDGSRVFFSSTDAIVPGDTNGKSDVYEWSGGTVHLVSGGGGHFDSTFYDASADGKDVVFATGERLVGQDTDSHVDLYDARAEGGFPAPPVALPQCEGEACRTSTSAVPASVAAGTVGFSAPPSQPKPRKPAKPSSARAKALKACKAKPSKAKRKKCESQVKKRFADKKRSANKSGRGK
jgi:Tol biopolymer transport system component